MNKKLDIESQYIDILPTILMYGVQVAADLDINFDMMGCNNDEVGVTRNIKELSTIINTFENHYRNEPSQNFGAEAHETLEGAIEALKTKLTNLRMSAMRMQFCKDPNGKETLYGDEESNFPVKIKDINTAIGMARSIDTSLQALKILKDDAPKEMIADVESALEVFRQKTRSFLDVVPDLCGDVKCDPNDSTATYCINSMRKLLIDCLRLERAYEVFTLLS